MLGPGFVVGVGNGLILRLPDVPLRPRAALSWPCWAWSVAR